MSAYATFFFEKEQRAPSNDNTQHSSQNVNKDNRSNHNSMEPIQASLDMKEYSDEKMNNGWYQNPANDLFISILSASVNPIHLIQSFTRRSSTASTKIRQRISNISNSITGFHKPHVSCNATTTKMNNTTDTTTVSTHSGDDDIWGEYSDQIHDNDETATDTTSTSTATHTVPLDISSTDPSIDSAFVSNTRPHHNGRPYESNSSTYNHVDDSSNPQEDAIEFNLSIAFNGRKYTATRALQSFVKLRKDLLVEYSKNRSHKKRHGGGQYHNGPRSSSSSTTTSSFVKEQQHSLETTPGLTKVHHPEEEEEEEEELIIPELPIGSSNKSQGLEHGAMHMMGMVGNGFRGLQEAVFSYAPPMESWIRTVAALVPTSQALANFLWEPIDQMDSKVNSMNLHRVHTLNSIHEGCDDGHESGSSSGEDDQW